MKKIQFFNTYPGVLETFPIEPASKAIPKWVRVARDDYVKNKNSKQNHVFRCPGIADIYKTGYVVRAWHDFVVEADSTYIRAETPTDALSDFAMDIHQADGVAKFLPQKHYSCKSILKLNTPWHVISPVKLLVIPFPYADHSDFESCIGILDPSVSTEVNIQVYWNRPNAKTYVSAGTPLCLLVPLTEDDCELDLRFANQKDLEWLKKRHYLINMSFISPVKKMKDLYNKVWKMKEK